jgi:hypothetical protein
MDASSICNNYSFSIIKHVFFFFFLKKGWYLLDVDLPKTILKFESKQINTQKTCTQNHKV